MPNPQPTDQDRQEAIRRVLDGVAKEDDVFDIAAAVADLHPRHNTFPGEVFMALGARAMDAAGVTAAAPIPYEGLREAYLPECHFRGRDNRKIQYAILTTAAARGGIEPDLLDEVIWWHADDYWRYALYAAVAIIRSCAARAGVDLPQFAEMLTENA